MHHLLNKPVAVVTGGGFITAGTLLHASESVYVIGNADYLDHPGEEPFAAASRLAAAGELWPEVNYDLSYPAIHVHDVRFVFGFHDREAYERYRKNLTRAFREAMSAARDR
jgi:hypothetical protein